MPDEARNPFTRAILKQIEDPTLQEFVSYWDALELLVIRVFRAKAASQEDEVEYSQLRSWLYRNYGRWKEALLPYWQQARIAGQPSGQDPFLYLLSENSASWFSANWTAMQHLPAAREALNQYLIDQANPEL